MVDDNDQVRAAMKKYLVAANLEVELFASGVDFLEWVQTRQPNCVILDVDLPHIDGLTVQARLTEEGFRVPIVFLTGDQPPETRQKALADGAAAFLEKPVTGAKLIETIATAITVHERLRQPGR